MTNVTRACKSKTKKILQEKSRLGTEDYQHFIINNIQQKPEWAAYFEKILGGGPTR